MEFPAFLSRFQGISVLQLGASGRIIFCNRHFKERLSILNDCEGEHISAFINPAALPGFNRSIKTCFSRGSDAIQVLMKTNKGVNILMNWELALDNDEGNTGNSVIALGYEPVPGTLNQDEQLLEEPVINSLPGIFYLQDEQGNYLRWNKNFEDVSGYSAAEIASLNPLVFFDKKDHEKINSAIGKVFREGFAEVEAEVVRRNKEVVPYFFNGKLIYYKGKKCLVGTGIDITGKISAQRAVEKSERMYHALFEQASDPIMVTDFKGNFIDVNSVMCKLFGYSKEELLKLHISNLIDSSDLQATPIRFDRLAEGDHIFSKRRMVHKNGSIIYVEANVKKLNADLVMAIARDVTERIRETEEKEHIRYTLNERVKELTTLYRFGRLLQADELSLRELLKSLVAVLPGGWQYPEITAARIVFAKEEFSTGNYRNSPYKQQVAFKTQDGADVMLEVVYLEKRPRAVEGPFLAEERHLVNMLAEMFRIYLTRKEESEALKKSEANLRSIFDATDSIYVLTDKNFRIISFNKPALEFAKREVNRRIRMNDPITNFVPVKRRGPFLKYMKKALAGEPVFYEVPYLQKDGSTRWYDTRILNIAGEQGEVFGIVVAVLETTEKKLLENKVLEQKVQEQKKISRAIIRAQEKERNYLGQELHDNVSQWLVGVKLAMKAAGEEHGELKKMIRYPLQLIDNSIQEIRQLSSRQVTPVKNIRLKKLVETLLANWKKNLAIKTKFVYKLNRHRLGDDLKLNIYRIIQEQVNNISRYAKANNVSISILTDKNKLQLRIIDDGIGFNTNKKRKGIGISNMINRVTAFNGEFNIESSKGKGCKITVLIPLNDIEK